MNGKRTFAILPAAGCGERFSGEVPKQFVVVRGKPILCYTIEAFLSFSWVHIIVVVVPQEWMKFCEDLIRTNDYKKVKLIPGKDSRHRSIVTGLNSILDTADYDPDDIVIVHDAVRPFLKEDFMKEVTEAAVKHKGAGAVRRLVSTVVKCDVNGFLDTSLNRSVHRESHTPQAFHIQILKKAYSMCSEDDLVNGTECLHLVQMYCGVSSKLIEGPEYLWKVTHKKDLILMETQLNSYHETSKS